MELNTLNSIISDLFFSIFSLDADSFCFGMGSILIFPIVQSPFPRKQSHAHAAVYFRKCNFSTHVETVVALGAPAICHLPKTCLRNSHSRPFFVYSFPRRHVFPLPLFRIDVSFFSRLNPSGKYVVVFPTLSLGVLAGTRI